ncbi:MAG: hypothetical protein AAF741_00580 [Bacteroidota bacterium]
MSKLFVAVMIFAVSTTSSLQAQEPPVSPPPNLWATLARITYEKKYDELLGFKIDMPVFSEAVEALEGQMVEVEGYIVPVEGYRGHTEFIFSAYPYNMCFFCGGAGPETVMEVTTIEPVEYTTEKIKLRGKLLLNSDNINRLMYILVDAEEVTK